MSKPKGRKHECKESRVCCCFMLALEPDDQCPVHGYPYPTRCDCGKFVKGAKGNG